MTLHEREVLTQQTKPPEVACDAAMERLKGQMERHGWRWNASDVADGRTVHPWYATFEFINEARLKLDRRVSGAVRSRGCDQQNLDGLAE